MMSTHRKVFCVLLGFQLAVSGCGEHMSVHCRRFSGQIAADPGMRENYNSILTPITDVATECYCRVEDAALVTTGVTVVAGSVVLRVVAESFLNSTDPYERPY
jgi:hypothetical protein